MNIKNPRQAFWFAWDCLLYRDLYAFFQLLYLPQPSGENSRSNAHVLLEFPGKITLVVVPAGLGNGRQGHIRIPQQPLEGILKLHII